MWFWQSSSDRDKETRIKRFTQMSKSLFRRMKAETPPQKAPAATSTSAAPSYFLTPQYQNGAIVRQERNSTGDLPSFKKNSAVENINRPSASNQRMANSSSRVAVALPNIDSSGRNSHQTGPASSRVVPMINSRSNPSETAQVPVSASSRSLSASSSMKSSKVQSGPPAKLCCDKCDGKHETDDCPYYKKSRESHPDAQKNFYKKMGGTSTLPGATYRTAKVVRQPGDGSCLFHSMSYGLRDGSSASSLRAEICAFIQRNPTFLICETPLSDWVKWDSGTSCTEYSRKMSRGSWGGGIEMACAAHIKGVNVHVYEQTYSGGFKRISAFDHPDDPETKRTVRVLYRGGVHYDALVAD